MNLKVKSSLRSHIPFLRLIFFVGKDTSHFTDFEQFINKISRFADFEQDI